MQTESEFLKTVIIPDSLPSSSTFRQRLEFALPSGYSIVGMDVYADDALDTQSQSLIYDNNSYADLIFDSLLMMNASQSITIVTIVIEKEIRFHSDAVTALILDPTKLEDINADTDQEEIIFHDADAIADELRGMGYTPPFVRPVIGSFFKSEHEIITLEEVDILAKVSYNSISYGIITAIEDDRGKFKYKTTKIAFVPA